jgi:hypothetical protein
MGFADVANAEIKKGKEGEQEIIEFVKKAGTKGSTITAADLVARLRHVPREPSEATDVALITRLLREQLTFEEAVGDDRVRAALRTLTTLPLQKGAGLCRTLDQLPAVADHDPRGW